MNALRLLNWVKVGAIKLADLLDHQPWEEFTRSAQPKYAQLLSDKAAKFYTNMTVGFSELDGTIVQYIENVPRDGNIDMGDQCLWQGIAAAMTAIKYSVTKSVNDNIDLLAMLNGMEKQYHNLRLVRGVRADGSFQDDVSNDQLSGHLCGLYFAWKYGSDAVSHHAAALLMLVATELLDNDNSLINQDGTPTTYGQLDLGWKSDPLRVTLLLAVMKFASVASYGGDSIRAEYTARYAQLLDECYPLIKYPKVRFWSLDTQYDTHRAAIHLSILADLETGDVKQRAQDGLQRIWKMIRRSANPWIFFLVRRQVPIDQPDLDNCLKHLQEFTVEDKNNVTQKINSVDPSVKTLQWGGYTRATQPIPRWKAGSQDFFWQRHLYSVDDWIGQTNPSITYNGLDFLVAYWGLRNLNLISGDM